MSDRRGSLPRSSTEHRGSAPSWLNWDHRITLLPLALVSFFGWASTPEPLALFCAPLAFATVSVVYGLLGLRWPETLAMASICFLLGCAALAATLVGMATHSYGWGFLTFAAGVIVAGFVNWKLWAWRRRR